MKDTAEKKTFLSEEVAQDQLQIFCDYYDIDSESASEEQKKAIEIAQRKLIRAIQKGRLTITDKDGVTVIQNLLHPPGDCQDIKYRKITGKSRLALTDKDSEYKRMYSLLGHLSGLPLNAIAALQGQDLSTAEYLAVLFLAV